MGVVNEYRMYDGTIIGGNTPAEVVDCMASYKLTMARDRERYRHAAARRARETYKVDIDPTTDESFIRTMLQAEILSRVI